MPLPFALSHVNCWLMADSGGWSIVDCGINDSETGLSWNRIAEEVIGNAPVHRIIATHGHTDHVGAAGFLCDTFQAGFTSTLVEWQSACLRLGNHGERPVELARFLRIAGCGPEMEEAFATERTRVARYLGRLPGAIRRIRDGQSITLDGEEWRVIVTRGHADEHACFYNEARRIIIAGDQVLPSITPLVSVFHWAPEENPLGDFLASLQNLLALPDDLLVLPGHGSPFYGLHHRIHAMVEHHQRRLAATLELMRVPATAFEISNLLFPTARGKGQGRLALGETLAHINHLVTLGEAICEAAADGRRIYRFN
ncbi:MBL fold metallo-hydrolase [Propylenella binzhouense]|nr:MBL fold metallo-hydrolase [Propylenella binzhouense]